MAKQRVRLISCILLSLLPMTIVQACDGRTAEDISRISKQKGSDGGLIEYTEEVLNFSYVYCSSSESLLSGYNCEKNSEYGYNQNWLNCDADKCKNCSIPNKILKCGSRKNLTLLTTNCATFSERDGYIEAGYCVYNAGNIHTPITNSSDSEDKYYLTLPINVTEMNEFMCGTLFNRAGTLCGKCKEDYYPLVYSFDVTCVSCPKRKSNWWKFVLVAFLPLTAFYFIVLFCRLNITSSHLYGFVWYCQLLFTPSMGRVVIVFLRNNPTFQVLVRYIFLLVEIWNLDFFRSLNLGICLEIDILQIQILDLAVGIYPLLLIVLSYLLIVLYDRNFRLVVIIWKPFGALFDIMFGRNWEIKTSLIDAFATFFLLSNIKILSVCASLLAPVVVYNFNSTRCYDHSVRLYYDATVPYFGERHLPYAILAIVVLLFFILLPMLLLMLYPFCWFQKILNQFHVRWYILHTFMDAFQGCYKDGTQPGTRDCRFFASLFFFVQFLAFVIAAYTPTLMAFPLTSILFIVFTILLVTVQPFKPNMRHYTDVNAIFILNLALFNVCCIGLSYSDEKAREQHMVLPFLLISFLAGFFLPLLYISVIILHWLYNHKKFGLRLTRRLSVWRRGYNIME